MFFHLFVWVHLFLCNICCFLCLFACACLFLLHCECVCVWLFMGGQADAAEPTAAWRAIEAGYTHSCTHTLYTWAQLFIYYSCTNCSQMWRSDIKVTFETTRWACADMWKDKHALVDTHTNTPWDWFIMWTVTVAGFIAGKRPREREREREERSSEVER